MVVSHCCSSVSILTSTPHLPYHRTLIQTPAAACRVHCYCLRASPLPFGAFVVTTHAPLRYHSACSLTTTGRRATAELQAGTDRPVGRDVQGCHHVTARHDNYCNHEAMKMR